MGKPMSSYKMLHPVPLTSHFWHHCTCTDGCTSACCAWTLRYALEQQGGSAVHARPLRLSRPRLGWPFPAAGATRHAGGVRVKQERQGAPQ